MKDAVVQINSRWRVTFSKDCWILEKKSIVKDKKTKEEKETWCDCGYFYSLHQMYDVICESGIVDEKGKLLKMKEYVEEMKEAKENFANVLISLKERVIIKEKKVYVKTKEFYQVFPDDKRKKPVLIKKETYDEHGNLESVSKGDASDWMDLF